MHVGCFFFLLYCTVVINMKISQYSYIYANSVCFYIEFVEKRIYLISVLCRSPQCFPYTTETSSRAMWKPTTIRRLTDLRLARTESQLKMELNSEHLWPERESGIIVPRRHAFHSGKPVCRSEYKQLTILQSADTFMAL